MSARSLSRTRRSIAAIGCTTLVALMAACGSSGTDSDSDDSGADADVRIRLAGDFDSLDPAKFATADSMTMVMALYDRVIGLDTDGNLVPWLASSWEPTANGVTLTIRDGATCADGTPVTADVVAASLTRLGAPETAASSTFFTFGPAGSTVQAEGDQVMITTNAPWHDLLRSLAMPWAGIVCPAGLKDTDALVTGAFGSGPYALTKVDRGSEYVLTARPEYNWGPDGMSMEDPDVPAKLVFKVVASDTTAANMFATDELDVGYILSQDFKRLTEDDSLWHFPAVKLGVSVLLFNQDQGRVAADETVRRALSLAVDPLAYIEAAAFGEGVPAESPVGSAMPCFDPSVADVLPAFDPEAAKQMLIADGWAPDADGMLVKDGKPLTIQITGITLQNSGPEYLQSALAAIGIDAKVRKLDVNSWVETLVSGDFDVTALSTAPPPLSPISALAQMSGPTPPAGANFGRIPNPTVAEALAAAEAATSDEDSCSAWATAQQSLVENADVLPLMDQQINYFGNGVRFEVLNALTLDPLTIRRTH